MSRPPSLPAPAAARTCPSATPASQAAQNAVAFTASMSWLDCTSHVHRGCVALHQRAYSVREAMTYDAHSAKIVSATGTRSSAKSVTHCMWRSSQISCHIVFVSFDAGDHASTATAASAHTTQAWRRRRR